MSGSWGDSSFMMQEIVLYQLKERAAVPLKNEPLTVRAFVFKGEKDKPLFSRREAILDEQVSVQVPPSHWGFRLLRSYQVLRGSGYSQIISSLRFYLCNFFLLDVICRLQC